MLEWLTRQVRSRSTPSATGLAARLRDYPPYVAPHVGPPRRWTDAQAHQNLAHLMSHKPERLAGLARFLDPVGIDIRPALDGGPWEPTVQALHQWANAHWPALHDPRHASTAHWLASLRQGEDIVYSLLLDVALLLGELVVQRHPGFRWDLDLDPQNGRDDMTSYRRVVLLQGAPASSLPQVELDVEAVVVAHYQRPTSSVNWLRNEWAALVSDAVSGAYDPR
ncbi:hypothetical protein [Rhizobacter sp. LjRoot28]|uniref:hypothetical protein n=1 Tax=Rhizobacter sp. LjRoot28 TaxID=3342309 RepID=UPI003ECE5E61